MEYFGYAGSILYVDLTTSEIRQEILDMDMAKKYVGGGGFSLRLVADSADPMVAPFAPENVIVYAPGALCGTAAPGASKLSLTYKQPLTNSWGSCSGSGALGFMIKAAGYDAVVITGKASKPVYLLLEDKPKICDAEGIWGLDLADATQALWKKHDFSSVHTIGAAGENLVKHALGMIDMRSTMGRGGLAAVMAFNINRDTSNVIIFLSQFAYAANAITVTANRDKLKITSTETDNIQLTARDIKQLPALMGETDFMRIIKLKPGIQAANDANMGFYVRGGGADQNLILLDNIPVYNPSHIMGFFSVFNTDVISSAKLIKSGMPANYGGRISSITDIKTKSPDLNEYNLRGNIGLLSSKLSIDVPVVKNKAGILISFRRTYLDEVIKPLIKPFIKRSSSFVHHSKYYFSDINGKFHWRINAKNNIDISGYLGEDFYSLKRSELDFNNQMIWGNKVISAIWNNRINKDWNIKTTAGYTFYSFNLKANQEDVNIAMLSNIEDYVLKSDFTYANENGAIIRLGTEYINHNFRPNNLDATAHSLNLQFGANRLLKAHESAVYFNHEFDISPVFRISYGLREVFYLHTGPYYELIKNEIGETSDSIYHPYNKPVKPYFSSEPRISIRYRINTASSVKAAFTYNSQNVHMVSPSSVTLPTDVWLPATENVKPQKGYQLNGGYYRNFPNNKFYSSLSVYYKKYENQIELLYGIINNFEDNNFEESMTFGEGFSYGSELYLQKKWGKITGWFAYTLSFSNRKFSEINHGNIFPAKYDRRHDLNLVLVYNLSNKLSVSGTFIFASGNAYTIPEYMYILEGNIISGTENINSFRMPAYHRLDLSLNYIRKKTEKFELIWNISVFNTYNRANPFYIYFETKGNISEYNLSITPKQITVFPILPSISWLFKF